MKKHITFLVISLLILTFSSCTSEYSGDVNTNQKPILTFNTFSDSIEYLTKKLTNVKWYSNDPDGLISKYIYTVTGDTTLTGQNALNSIAKWDTTESHSADVSFLFNDACAYKRFNTFPVESTLVIGDSTYTDTVRWDTVKTVFSKFIVYAIDENKEKSNIISRVFGRTNKRPNYAKVLSDKLHLGGNFSSWEINDHYKIPFPIMILKTPTLYWNDIDFAWASNDPDGSDVILEYSTSLSYYDNSGLRVVVDSTEWNQSNRKKNYSEIIFDENATADYYFKVFTRDDAEQQSAKTAIVKFHCFVPKFDKGILILNNSNMTYDENDSTTWIGNPDSTGLKSYYKSLLNGAGYTEDNSDPLKKYDWVDIQSLDPQSEDSLKLQPENLSNYRMVLICNDSRTPDSQLPFDFNFKTDGDNKFGTTLYRYLNTGGKIFTIGGSIFLDCKSADTYTAPIRYFPKDNGQFLNTDFHKDKMGIYSLTQSERFGRRPTKDNYGNYDFIGVNSYSYTSDLKDMIVDSAKVNKYWKYIKYLSNNIDIKYDYRLKDNGSTFTGITTMQSYLGEPIFEYKSAWDDSTHHSIHLEDNSYCQHRTGPIGNRYIGNNDAFRTAHIGLPIFFMDNSENAVSDNFKAMIDWFKLDLSPLD